MDEQKQITSPLKAIKQFCFECNGRVRGEAEKCTSPRCALFPFRLGKNPYHEPRKLTEEQKAAAAERFRKMREKKAGE